MLQMIPSYEIAWSGVTLRVIDAEIATVCTVLARSGIKHFTVTANRTWNVDLAGKAGSDTPKQTAS